jgi:predicted DNA-binding protein (MmcQ/YjbR family)
MGPMAPARSHHLSAVEEFALSLPEAWVDTPWGEQVVKVGKKIFVFLSPAGSDDPVITIKLPDSGAHGLSYPGADSASTGG